MVLQELFAKVGFKVDKASLAAVNSALGRVKGALGGVASAVAPLAKAIGLGGVGLGAMATAALNASMQMEGLRTEFGVLMQDMQKGSDLFDKVHAMAVATPFDDKSLAKATKTLLAYGVAGEDIMQTLTMLGDVAGADNTKLQYLSLVYGQVMNAGRLKGDDLRQMVNWGVNPLGIIAEKRGISYGEATELMSQRQISAAEVADAFRTMTSEGGRFYKSTEIMAKTSIGRWNQLKGTMFNLMATIGDQLMPVATSFMQWLSSVDFTPITDFVSDIGYYAMELVDSVFGSDMKSLPYFIDDIKARLIPVVEVLGKIVKTVEILAPLFIAAFGPAIIAWLVRMKTIIVEQLVIGIANLTFGLIKLESASKTAFMSMTTGLLGALGVAASLFFMIKQIRDAGLSDTEKALRAQEVESFMSGETSLGGPEGQLEFDETWVNNARAKYDAARRAGNREQMAAARKELSEAIGMFNAHKDLYYEGTNIYWESQRRTGVGDAYQSLRNQIEEQTQATKEQTKVTRENTKAITKISSVRSAFDSKFNVHLKSMVVAAANS